MALKGPRGAVAAKIEIRRTICCSAGDSEARGIEKGRGFCFSKPDERLQRPRGAVVDPDTIVAQDPMDLPRQSLWLMKEVDQKRGDDASDRAVGKGGVEGVHGYQLDRGAARSTLTPAKGDVARRVDGACHGEIEAVAIQQVAHDPKYRKRQIKA